MNGIVVLIGWPSVYRMQEYKLLPSVVNTCRFIHSPRNGPLFLLELNLGPSGVQYSVELSLFESTLVGLFDKGIQVTHSIPQLEKVRANLGCFCGVCSKSCTHDLAVHAFHPITHAVVMIGSSTRVLSLYVCSSLWTNCSGR